MNTDVTRGPRRCPSCGKENPPTAAHCILCSTLLDGAIQTTPASAWNEVRLPSLLDDEPTSRPPLKGCAAVAAAVGVGFLLLASFVVTFFTVCTAMVVPSPLNPHGDVFGGALAGIPLGLAAAVFVVVIVVIILRRCGWR